jgi:hypothetical protein
LGLAAKISHDHARDFHVVQSWPAGSTGELTPARVWRKHTGFDFELTLRLPSWKRPDVWNVELIWQQWLARYGRPVFSPEWSLKKSLALKQRFMGRVKIWLHIELSEFTGMAGCQNATLEQLQKLILQSQEFRSDGIDVYDYSLWRMGMRAAIK